MSIHPVAFLVVLAVAVALMVLPREKLLAPFLLVAVFLPLAQGFDVAGLDITFARFLIFTVWLRFIFRQELTLNDWNSMDTAVLLWCGIGAVAYILLWGTLEAFINRMGQFVNYAGTYFLVRLSIRKTADVTYLTKYLRLAAIVLAVFMMMEWLTGRNVFALFGGVAEITDIRDGLLRARGPFGHPIGAGLFAASLVPIFLGCMFARAEPARNVTALVSAIFIVVSTASSAPVLALAAGVGAWCFWPLKRHMRLIAWGATAVLVGLHFIMNAPVWALIWRVSVFGASTGYHRFSLFNQFMLRIDEWWLVGTQSTAHWGSFLEDVANNYVRIGVNGGLFTLLAFLFLLRCGFKSLGAALRVSEDSKEQALLWSLGASLMVHVVGSFGVSYWDQIIFLFALLLGLVSASSNAVLSRSRETLGRETSQAATRGAIASRPRVSIATPTPRFP